MNLSLNYIVFKNTIFMNKKLLCIPLWGIFALSLLSSCRSEDGVIQQKQNEAKYFKVFIPKKENETINYANGFAFLMKRYDELQKTNLSGVNNKLIVNNLSASTEKNASVFQNANSYVEFNIRSEVFTEKNGDKWVAFPKIQGEKVTALVVSILTDKKTYVKYLTFGEQSNLYKVFGDDFQEAFSRYRKQLVNLRLNAAIKPIAGGGETLIPEVIITVPRPGGDISLGPWGDDGGSQPGGGCGAHLQCDYMDGSGGGGSNGGDSAPSEEQVQDQIKDQPFALVDAPCDVVKKWLATAKFTPGQAQLNKLKTIVETSSSNSSVTPGGLTQKSIAHIQKLNDAYSPVVNMDYFPVTVNQLPIVNGTRLTPEQFLNYIRKNIDNFVDGGTTFTPYNGYGYNDSPLWNSTNPLGTIININIGGSPDNGSVMVTSSNSNKWTFTTIYEPIYGEHPVSGNRDFGFDQNTDGSYTFYTRGIDRLTDMAGDGLRRLTEKIGRPDLSPFGKADALWTSLQKNIEYFVNHHEGSSSVSKQEISRPNWQKLKDVLDGRAPLSTLSKDCGK